MAQLRSNSADEIPRWLIWVGSVVILGHLTAVAGAVLAAPSGPWPAPGGSDTARPPQFAIVLKDLTGLLYANWIRMTDNYRFPSNEPGAPDVSFEVRLKDAKGNDLKTLRFPEDDANFAVRNRQSLLARGLNGFMPIRPPEGEAIPPPGQKVDTVRYWEPAKPPTFELRKVPVHLVPRDHPVEGPTGWTMLLARCYVRYLCRAHGAASGELIRHVRDPLPPPMFDGPTRAEEFAANFGDPSRE